ncbi:MAG: hypothetical protein JW716_01885 [Candidatus Aenigmarchaeota archaeon]|nr:hypothetical protein [Candidatus Aenigmarchaeota archaeon]
MNRRDLERHLEDVGLTKSEAKVYLALLELGASTTGPLVTLSKTADSKIYVVLEKLVSKGMASSFKRGGVRLFKAAPPNQILSYLKEKKSSIEKQEQMMTSVLPFLSSLAGSREEEKESAVFSGPKGMKAAFADVIDSLDGGETVCILGVHSFGEKFKRLGINFHRNRSEKGIKVRFLVNHNATNIADEFLKYQPATVRLMDESIFTLAIFLIYKNKVIISLADEMTMFMIKSQRAKDSFQSYFEKIWKLSKPYRKKK